ncbi:hypothetical protein Ciccas_012712 [Cichlidogyrus casuarinus]|uniref:Potassium channel domain-containing protein n=1 Tax=Cichlidogyrus casuarinus TaxID=1844966 RepID=A0ABD2PSM5_9PLAT
MFGRSVYVNLCCCRCGNDYLKARRMERRRMLRELQAELEEHEKAKAMENGDFISDKGHYPILVADEDEDDDYDAEDTFDPDKELSVPIMVSVSVLSGYVMCGSYLFKIWETWTLNDGAYFSFITISTVGFGDLVPGMGRFHEPETVTELIIGAIYCVFGLSLLSMCFTLVQCELIRKFSWIGQKFGFQISEKKLKNNIGKFKRLD